MFTGIIEITGRIVQIAPSETGCSLLVDPGEWAARPAQGDSIAVNGCCLTVANTPNAAKSARFLRFDVIHQTLRLTTLGELAPGDRVNLEQAVTPRTLLGGHLVQGHVDGVGLARRVENPEKTGEFRLRIQPPPALMDVILPQGSITVDGVSLTVAAVGPDWFDVALIPTTLDKTTLRRVASEPGTRVNLEADSLVRMVAHLLKRAGLVPDR